MADHPFKTETTPIFREALVHNLMDLQDSIYLAGRVHQQQHDQIMAR